MSGRGQTGGSTIPGLEVFHGQGEVDLSRVERELQNLWKQAAEEIVERGQPPVTHVSTVNLVILTSGGEELERVSKQAVELTTRHPGRYLVVQEERGEDSLSAFISAQCQIGDGNRQICSEFIRLIASGKRVGSIAQTVASLLIPDLPTVLWVPGDPLAITVPRELVDLSDRIIVDSHHFPDTRAALQNLHQWCEADDASRLSDLAWLRLERWRSLTAQMFEDPEAQADLQRIRRVEVDYLTSRQGAPEGRLEALYYLGWMAAQLGYATVDQRSEMDGVEDYVLVHADHRRFEARAVPHLRVGDAPGDLMRVCLMAGDHDCRYEIKRQSDRDVATLIVQAERSCPLPTQVGLVSQDVLSSLTMALDRHRSDPVFRRALRTASDMMGTQ